MNKKEVLEIRKQFSPKNCAITRICGCYVDHEKNIILESKDAFLSLPEEEEFKYFEIFRHTLSGTLGKNLVGMDPMDIRKSGVAMSFVPEDRLGMGLVGSMGMTGNMMLRSWKKGKGVFVNRKDPNELAMNIWKELEVVTPSTEFPVRRMSGGNVQKVLVGREIAQQPSVLMTAYAVRGLDINTSYTIYNLLTEQKMKGVAVVYVGEDLDVLLELCDRIVVLCGGQVSGVVDARKTNKLEVGALMTRVEGGAKENA